MRGDKPSERPGEQVNPYLRLRVLEVLGTYVSLETVTEYPEYKIVNRDRFTNLEPLRNRQRVEYGIGGRVTATFPHPQQLAQGL